LPPQTHVVQAGHVGQIEIDEGQFGTVLPPEAQSTLAVGGRDHAVPRASQDVPENVAKVALILDD
jgi:hypothetical protein